MQDGAGSAVRDSVRQMAAVAANVPVAVAFTVLGASVMIGREVVTVLSGLLPFTRDDEPTTRHHAGRVREQVRAAKQAARAAGVLRRRPR
jgi:hypothetical protein